MSQSFFRRSIICLWLFVGTWTYSVEAQAPMPAKSAAEIQHALKKLQTVGSVLYLAAHPDDENQRLIAYFAKGKGYRTGYLALTRGDGGQNLIGDEIGPHLGMLRTQELLAARRIDGGEQMFSRAYDFGYSKGPEETLEIWDEEKVLGDVVWAIRKFRPDIIITRFATPEKGGGGHGHHTTSAILAHQAFALAADPKAYPEQLAYVDTWQPKRLLWNNYWVFRRYQPSEKEKKGIATVNIGEWNPLLGESYGEMAMRARSMHKCQAFGAALLRGDQIEYLEQELGDPMTANGVMDGVDTSWDRVPGAEKIADLLAQAYTEFSPENPAASVPVLMEAYALMQEKEGYWFEVKSKELREIIAYCAGIYFELNSDLPQIATGDTVGVTARYLMHGDLDIALQSLRLNGFSYPIPGESGKLTGGKLYTDKLAFPVEQAPGQPYWLQNPQAKGIFNVTDQTLIGLPENPAAYQGTYTFSIAGQEISFQTPVVHRYVDPAVGELYRPFIVSPKVAVNISKKVYLFAGTGSQEVQLQVKSFGAPGAVSLEFETPKGWTVAPASLALEMNAPGEERIVQVSVSAPATQSQGQLKVWAVVDGRRSNYSFREIAYGHIPTQWVFDASQARLVRVALQKKGERIAYIMGSGDEVAVGLEQIGYQVDILADDQITVDKLKGYDAVIAGIRAYNTNARMPYHQTEILKYVEQGGTYIVQYMTTRSLSTQPGPYPLKISRERTTDEESKMVFLAPDHPVVNSPNKLTEADFEDWIQERGLYYAGEWDERYTPIFASADKGEAAVKGGLLVAEYGKGYFMYTGLSFFRELPAGVPGAYRLIANMISIGK